MLDNAQNNKRIAKNSLFMSLRMVVVLFLSLYTTRLILRILGIEDFGIFNVVGGFVSMFGFLNTSMSNGIQRFYNFEYSRNGEEGAHRVYCTAIHIQAILAIILFILCAVLGEWYIQVKMVIPTDRIFAAKCILYFSLFSFVFVILQVPYSAAIMAHERMDFYALISIIDAVLKLGVVLALSFIPYDNLIAYGILLFSICVFEFILYLGYCKKHFVEMKYELVLDKTLFLNMIGFSGWNIFGSFSGVMKEQGINLVLNLFFGPIVNAARGIAAQVNSGLQSFVANLTIPVRPQVIQSYAIGDIQRTLNLTYSISKISCAFLYMIALPLAWELEYVLQLWLGDNIPAHTSSFVIIMLLISILNNLNAAVSGVVHATGEMKVYQLFTSLIAVSSVPLAYIALKLGAIPEWALLMVFITMIFAQAASLIILKRLITFSILAYCKQVLWPLLILFVMTIWIPYIIIIIMSPCFLRLVINILVSCISILLVLYFTGLNDGEKQLITEMTHKVKSKFLKS